MNRLFEDSTIIGIHARGIRQRRHQVAPPPLTVQRVHGAGKGGMLSPNLTLYFWAVVLCRSLGAFFAALPLLLQGFGMR